MKICKHCGGRIYLSADYRGPAWRHDRGDFWCPPATRAEPLESTGRIRDSGPIKLSV